MLKLDKVVMQIGAFRLWADWDLPPGAKVAVIGPSGCGKSSLLLLIAGFLGPQSGRLLWQGHEMTQLAAQSRPMSMLFQDQNLFPHMTLLQNVVLGLTSGRRAQPDQTQRARAALARVGLDGMQERRPHQVSGGQMARAALARVVLQARPILLLDEPFAALDSALRADMLDLVDQVAQDTGATVLMVSHDLRDAQRFADLVIEVGGNTANAPVPATIYFDKRK